MGMIIKKIFSISKRKKQHLNTSDKEKFKFFLRNFTTVYLSSIWTKIIEDIHRNIYDYIEKFDLLCNFSSKIGRKEDNQLNFLNLFFESSLISLYVSIVINNYRNLQIHRTINAQY